MVFVVFGVLMYDVMSVMTLTYPIMPVRRCEVPLPVLHTLMDSELGEG